MNNGAAFAGFLFSAGIGVVIGYFLHGSEAASSRTDREVSAAVNENVFKVPVGDAHQKGPDDALVTIVEFSDFQCPFCARVGPTLEKVLEKYKGDVRLVFKHQPLPFHVDAGPASEYALAAGEQGRFWEMHDKLFANQRKLKADDLKRYARELQLDLSKIEAFIQSGRGKEIIRQDQELAAQVGATGTPGFFINGVQLRGAQPYDAFARIIDQQLVKARKLVKSGVPKSKLYATLIKNGRTTPAPRPQRPAQRPQRPRPPDTRQRVRLVDGAPTKGGKEPLVTILEFSDFECPFCSRVNPALKKILDTYGDDAQVRFHNLPLPFHPRARPAAQAALAAHKQGKFWEMHDKLFENQKTLGDADLERYARELGLDVQRFLEDMKSPEVEAAIKRDEKDAAAYGARGTPTLFVNGAKVVGALPFERFKPVIDRELAIAKSYLAKGVARSDVHARVIADLGGKVVGPAPAVAQVRPQPVVKPVPTPTKPVPTPEKPTPSVPEAVAPDVAQPAVKVPKAVPAPEVAAPAEREEVVIGNAPTTGAEDAPVQVVVFGDFACPYSGALNSSIGQIREGYGDKVIVSFKHWPLERHSQARAAAVASLAAHRQGKFWAMHDKLFANQKSLNREAFLSFARELELDLEKFEKDLADPMLMNWVNSDIRQGGSIGVVGTPSVFVNGRKVEGAKPYSELKAIIDQELENKEG